mgnify:CR=1 FL=1
MSEGVVIAAVLFTVILTLLWMAIHGYGLFRLGGQLSEVSKKAQLGWLLSLVGGFTGPCVLPISVIGMVLAVQARRSDDVNAATQKAVSTILLAGAIIIVEVAVLIAAMAVSSLLSA